LLSITTRKEEKRKEKKRKEERRGEERREEERRGEKKKEKRKEKKECYLGHRSSQRSCQNTDNSSCHFFLFLTDDRRQVRESD
jgi:hypothetical protein